MARGPGPRLVRRIQVSILMRRRPSGRVIIEVLVVLAFLAAFIFAVIWTNTHDREGARLYWWLTDPPGDFAT